MLERVNAGESTSVLDRTRYHLAGPEGGQDASEDEWKGAISNAETQLQHSEVRLTNVELLKKYGGERKRKWLNESLHY